MTEAIRKLPLSFTRLAAFGPGDYEGLLSDCVEERCHGVEGVASTGRNDEELARGRHIGTAEHRRCDEPLPGLCMSGLKLFRQSNADGARRNMRRACGQAADDATVTEYDPLDGIVVCQHGNHGIAAAGV